MDWEKEHMDWALAESQTGWALARGDGAYDQAWNARAKKWSQTLEMGMEDWATENVVRALELSAHESVIDVCCGPGRLTLPMAKVCEDITGMDGGEELLAKLRQRAQTHGLDHIKTLCANWYAVEPGRDFPQFDVAVACNSPALGDIQKFSRTARKRCIYVNLCKGPLMHRIIDDVYAGCTNEVPDKLPGTDQEQWSVLRSNYHITFGRLVSLGACPTVKYCDGGWHFRTQSLEKLCAHLAMLNHILPDKWDVFEENVSRYCTFTSDGVLFHRTHKMVIMSWDPNQVQQ